jgi:hypothetical protein
MAQPYGISGQVARLNIDSVGSFGVTKVTPNRTYVNPETTITQNNWQQYCPVVRGMKLDCEVPLDSSYTAWIDDAFDTASFDSPATINGLNCSLESNPAIGETFSGCGIIEDYKVVYDSKDAARLIFTILFTGKVTA